MTSPGETRPGLGPRLAARLEHRLAPLFFAVLAFVLTLPATTVGLVADDYFQRIVLKRLGGWTDAAPMRDLFGFFPGEGARWRLDPGSAWWIEPSIHVRFGRPLTALTHALDYALWPDTPALQHLQSLLWLGLGVGIVAVLYRRVGATASAAGLAGLLFAVEDAHSLVAGWLANRSTLLCLVFGVLALLLHVSWSRTRDPLRLASAITLFAVGLSCGEATVAACAYVFAWQLLATEGTLVERLLPVAPYALLIAGWRVLYQWLGFGARGINMYVDPGDRPLLFLSNLLERIPLLLGSQLLQTPVDLWLFAPRPAQLAAAAISAALVGGLLIAFHRLLRRDSVSRFWALGMVLSTIPFCTTYPQDRLLVFTGIGAFGLLAAYLEDCGVWPWRDAGPSWRRRLAVFLLVLHGPLAAVLCPLRIAALPLLRDNTGAVARKAPSGPEVSRQTFVFLNGSDFVLAYLPIIRTATGGAPVPLRMAQLTSMASGSRVTRTDDRTLIVAVPGGFLRHTFDRAFVTPGRRFGVGERLERADYVAEVRSVTDDARPLEMSFRFRVPLEDPSLRWLYWRDWRLVPFPLPAVGETVEVPVGLPL